MTKVNLHGVDITHEELASLYALTHDPNWSILQIWLENMRRSLATACLNSPEEWSQNLKRNGQHILVNILENLPCLTSSMVSDISKSKD